MLGLAVIPTREDTGQRRQRGIHTGDKIGLAFGGLEWRLRLRVAHCSAELVAIATHVECDQVARREIAARSALPERTDRRHHQRRVDLRQLLETQAELLEPPRAQV